MNNLRHSQSLLEQGVQLTLASSQLQHFQGKVEVCKVAASEHLHTSLGRLRQEGVWAQEACSVTCRGCEAVAEVPKATPVLTLPQSIPRALCRAPAWHKICFKPRAAC